jgi:SAM-dependent methyltransferase
VRRVQRGARVNGESPASAAGLFAADPAQVEWLGDRVLQHVAARPPRRVLDIGCGDGSLILHLARALPASTFLGVDLSATNVDAARARVDAAPARDRITIERGDFLALDAGRFDLVVASSSLQAMHATSRELADRLAACTAPGGLLIHLTPCRCAYNSVLTIARRALRQVRGPVVDRIIVGIARILHPRQPIDRLRQRVAYMYLVLRHDEDRLRAELESRHGYVCTHLEAAPQTSVGQPRHRLAVLSAPPG